MATLKNTTVNDTGFIQLPVGTTAQRPVSPANGMMRHNSSTASLEMYSNGQWVTIASSIVTSNLVIWLDAGNSSSYPGSGTAWSDLSNNGNGATLLNSASYSATGGGSISFNGSNQYANGTTNSSTDLTGDMSMDMWFRISAQPSDWVRVFGRGNTNTRTYGFWYNPSGPYFLYQRSGNLLYNFAYSLNTWYHVACTSNGSTHTMYVNGSSVGTATWSGATGVAEAWTLGYGLVHTYHNGLISAARLYNRSLTADEVLQNYNGEKSRYGY
jgi:Concanavalin A-like lectin/glucanases superfamily